MVGNLKLDDCDWDEDLLTLAGYLGRMHNLCSFLITNNGCKCPC